MLFFIRESKLKTYITEAVNNVLAKAQTDFTSEIDELIAESETSKKGESTTVTISEEMAKKTKFNLIPTAALLSLATLLFVLWYRRNGKTTNQVIVTPVVASGSGAGGGGSIPTIPSFILKDAWNNNGTFVNYTSHNDALDRNLEDSGLANRDLVVYALEMKSGFVAYNGNTLNSPKAIGGYFYYPTTGETVAIDGNGVMTFVADVVKPNVNEVEIKDAYQ